MRRRRRRAFPRAHRWRVCALAIGMSVVTGCAAVPPTTAQIAARTPQSAGTTATTVVDGSWWWGITIDDPAGIDAIISAIAALPARPVVRLVFDVDRPPDSYADEVRRISSVAAVMGLVVDSAEVAGLSRQDHRQRFESYVATLDPWISLWEVGNEVNGEWLGPASEVRGKIEDADRIVRQHGGTAILTVYDNQGCAEDPAHDMVTWVERELDPAFRASVPVVLLSHYPDHCSGRWPGQVHWQDTATRIGALFPHARWGIGETSVVDADGEDVPGQVDRKTALVDSCYRMTVPDARFLGGCFWWYFAEDAVPVERNPVWAAIAAAMADGPPR